LVDHPGIASKIQSKVTTSVSLFIAGESGLHRLNPVTKLLIALTTIMGGFAIPYFWGGYLLFLVIVLPIAIWGNIWKQLLSRVWKIVLPFAISVFLIQGLFWGSGTSLISIGPLTVYTEGILFASTSVGRILLVIGSFLLFSMSTRPDLLMNALNQSGVPGAITYIVVSTIQIIPRFQERAATVIDAQRSRGLKTEGNFLTRARALSPLILPLVLSSIVEIEERAIAIEARAFNSGRRKTSLHPVNDSKVDRALRRFLVLVLFLILAARIWLL
jgi:energy-coupling factor transport system permease protein